MKKQKQITAYRSFLTTDIGRRVFAHLIAESGLFDADLKPEDVHVENFVKKILHNMGICNTPESILELVNKLSEMKVS